MILRVRKSIHKNVMVGSVGPMTKFDENGVSAPLTLEQFNQFMSVPGYEDATEHDTPPINQPSQGPADEPEKSETVEESDENVSGDKSEADDYDGEPPPTDSTTTATDDGEPSDADSAEDQPAETGEDGDYSDGQADEAANSEGEEPSATDDKAGDSADKSQEKIPPFWKIRRFNKEDLVDLAGRLGIEVAETDSRKDVLNKIKSEVSK